MTALPLSLALLALCIVVSFFTGLVKRNYSTVDRLWSVLPPVYALIWLVELRGNPRFLIGAILVILWGIRLTSNFVRRGGYAWEKGKGFTGEDYRWEVIRKRIPHRVAFEFFNFFFISIFQLVLIFGFTFPLYRLGFSTRPLGTLDFVLFAVHALLLITETVADNQQYRFFGRRDLPKNASYPRYALGFNTTGLWRYSRHPNYVCEMGMWIVVSLYPVAAGLPWFPSGFALIVLVALFIGSTLLAEGITGSKYPRYADWKKATPPWLPLGLPFRMNARRKFWASVNESASVEPEAAPTPAATT